jgi:hypothetical protein
MGGRQASRLQDRPRRPLRSRRDPRHDPPGSAGRKDPARCAPRERAGENPGPKRLMVALSLLPLTPLRPSVASANALLELPLAVDQVIAKRFGTADSQRLLAVDSHSQTLPAALFRQTLLAGPAHQRLARLLQPETVDEIGERAGGAVPPVREGRARRRADPRGSGSARARQAAVRGRSRRRGLSA